MAVADANVPEDKRRKDYEYWLGEANATGKKPGWAAYQYKENYGDFPPFDWRNEWEKQHGIAPSWKGGNGNKEKDRPLSQPKVPQPPPGMDTCPSCGVNLRAMAAIVAAMSPEEFASHKKAVQTTLTAQQTFDLPTGDNGSTYGAAQTDGDRAPSSGVSPGDVPF